EPTLRVTDDDGLTDSDSLLIQAASSLLPQADLTADVTEGAKPLTVQFDAGGSTDPDGSIAGYEWDFDGDGSFGEPGMEADAGGQAQPQPVVYSSTGDYEVTVRVTDNSGDFQSASIVVTVQNSAPIAVLEASATEGTAPFEITFDASGSLDPGGSIVS